MAAPRVLINALHTHVGGGVTYLAGVLPHLLADDRLRCELLLTSETRKVLGVPPHVRVREVPRMGMLQSHLFEQLLLPWLCRWWGVSAVLCNANYVPLLAPRPVPILHTTVRAAEQWTGWKMRLYWLGLRWLTKLSLWRAPRVLAVARHLIADYAAGPWVLAKVRVAPPAVDDVPAGAPRDPNLVLAVGDFYAQKDYPTLLRAFALLREKRPASRLVIVGRPVYPRVRDALLEMIRDLGIADAVTLTGAMPRPALMATMAKATVYVSTSRAESVQLPLLEAMAMGTPVVAVQAPHTLEFVGEAGVLIAVDKGGDVAAAFAVALYGVLENHTIAEALRLRGLRRMQACRWPDTARVVAQALLDVA